MKIKITALILTLVLCLSLSFNAFAEEHPPRLVDDADLLDEYEEAEILQKLNEASERYQIDFVIVTVENNGGKTSRDFADDYFDYNGYGLGEGYDGILLLITQRNEYGDRALYISTHGKGITLLPDYRIEDLGDKMAEAFEDGGYAEMFDTFIRQTESYIRYDNGELDHDRAYDPLYYFDFESAILISLFIGFLVAIIATSIMKGQLKSVRFKREANGYVRNGSMNVTVAQDIYLYSTVNRRARPKDTGGGGRSGGSSTHTSSSGRTHGGGGRSF